MKKAVFLLLSSMTLSTSVFCQFNYIESINEEVPKVTFDSTFNFHQIPANIDPFSLIGQEIYFANRNPNRKPSDTLIEGITTAMAGNNPTFHPNKNFDNSVGYQIEANNMAQYYQYERATESEKKKMRETFVYKPVEDKRTNRPVTSYSAVEGSFFKITGMSILDSIKGKAKFTLLDSDKHTLYWEVYLGREGFFQPFTVFPFATYLRGYVEYIKEAYQNQTLYYKGKSWSISQTVYSPLDRKEHSIEKESKWHCENITFLYGDQPYGELYLILKNDNNEKIAVMPYREDEYGITNRLDRFSFWTEDEYNDFKTRETAKRDSTNAALIRQYKANVDAISRLYGRHYAQKIANGNVELGMTKDMCLLAWGEPYTETKISVGNKIVEVWYYSPTDWLSFTNNRLSLITQVLN